MKSLRIHFVVALFFAGCASANPYAIMRDGNRTSLAKVEIGMGKSQVESLMGSRVAEGDSGRYENPYKREIIRGTDGQSYDVLYYYTQQIGERTIETGLTPVVFNEGRVVGIGWGYLDSISGASTTTIRRR